MNLNWRKISYWIFGTILAVTALSQAIDKNYLAIFPLIGSVAFFINARRTNN